MLLSLDGSIDGSTAAIPGGLWESSVRLGEAADARIPCSRRAGESTKAARTLRAFLHGVVQSLYVHVHLQSSGRCPVGRSLRRRNRELADSDFAKRFLKVTDAAKCFATNDMLIGSK